MGQSRRQHPWVCASQYWGILHPVPSSRQQSAIFAAHDIHRSVCYSLPPSLFVTKTDSRTLSLISVVGFLDSIVAAKQNSARFGYTISPNRELVALGAANLVGSFIPGTLPAYGSITRYRWYILQ